jgi:CheY-like chemotaxis protein
VNCGDERRPQMRLSGPPYARRTTRRLRLSGQQPRPGRSVTNLGPELPEGFAEMARDQDFVTLLESFGTPEYWQQVRLKLERRPLSLESTLADELVPMAAAATPQPTAEQPEPDKPLRFAGMRVLWIDDHPENNQPYMENLRRAGADVAVASGYDEAERQLTHPGQVHSLISDIARGEDAEAGLTDLRRLRDASLYDGPAAFHGAGHADAPQEGC